MEQHKNHVERSLIAFIILFAIGIVVWRGPQLQYVGMKLYFPEKDGQTLRLEKRQIAPIGTFEARAIDVVSELLLGPISRNLQPVAVTDVLITRTIVRENVLFFDFAVSDLPAFSKHYKTFKSAIEKSLHATIPGNYHISLFINSIQAR